MRRSHLSLVTAAFLLLGALTWLAFGRALPALLWIAIGAGWLLTALVQRMRSDTVEPAPGARLFRRFSRLLLFWS